MSFSKQEEHGARAGAQQRTPKTERRQPDGDTAALILDVAERLAQSRGYNGFSYADVASELHLTKAALHYHFAGKAELGEALISRYCSRFTAALDALESSAASAPARLQGYANLYLEVLRRERMCLCGMLAAEYQTLPPGMQNDIVRFFDINEAWLQRVVAQGQQDGSLHVHASPEEIARAIVAGLEGAMLVARPYGSVSRFEAATNLLLTGLIVKDVAPNGRRGANKW